MLFLMDPQARLAAAPRQTDSPIPVFNRGRPTMEEDIGLAQRQAQAGLAIHKPSVTRRLAPNPRSKFVGQKASE